MLKNLEFCCFSTKSNHVETNAYFIAVIDGVFCLDAGVTLNKRETSVFTFDGLSGVRLFTLVTLQTL